MTTPSETPAVGPGGTEGEGVFIEAESFEAAVSEAASRLAVHVSALGIDVIDPGRSAAHASGFRPVRIRAWKRAPSEAPDGARPGTGGPRGGARVEGGGYAPRGGRRPFDRPAPPSYGPPPPPMDPERITPELVEETRAICEGLVRSMGLEARATGSKTKYGIRVGVEAGEQDQYLIGREGETLGAIQYMVSRMLRVRLREDSMPRIEVDVAGYRDRRNEELREYAQELMDEVRRTGDEVMTEPLPASERRIIHLEVAETPGLSTGSIGEGEFKRIVIRLDGPGGGEG